MSLLKSTVSLRSDIIGKMKKIGFVDYYISEWHANNYPEWIREACTSQGAEMQLAYAWGELDISPIDGRSTDEWCAEMGAERCHTLEELCEKSDVIVILAPSDPEKHLEYAKTVLRYGKLTYIDKTFASSLAEAQQIYALADKYGASIFSSSALRYASELDLCPSPISLDTVGSGSRFEEYIVHQCEMIVKKLGTGAVSLTVTEEERGVAVSVNYSDARSASMLWSPNLSFSVKMKDAAGESYFSEITSEFFGGLIADIVSFFGGKKPRFPREETLEVIAMVEAAVYGRDHLGEIINIG